MLAAACSSPSRPPSLHLPQPCFLLLLFLVFLASVPSLRCASVLSLQSLLVDVDEVSSFGLSDIVQAYQIVQPNVSFISSLQPTTRSTLDVSAGTVDFAVVSSGLTVAEAGTYPNLQLFPVLASAVVPVYRLDALGSTTLILSRQALASMYAGKILWWDDPAIQATNPAITLPHRVVRVVFDQEPSDVSLVWSTALNKFQSGFPVIASRLPTWPTSQYLDWDIATGPTGVAAMVLNEDGAIGYSPQSGALATGANIAKIINWAGQTVAPTSATITAAITEVTSGYPIIKRQTEQIDYTDGHGALSWPIPILSNLLVDMVNSRGTCHQRAAVVNFWSWYYTSTVPAALLANRQYAPIPAFLQSQLNPVAVLQTSLLCRGSPAVNVVSASARALSTSTGAQFLAALLAEAYRSVDGSVSWEAEVINDELVMEQVINAETDIGLFIPENVDAKRWQEMVESNQFLVLPTYLIGLAWMSAAQSTKRIAGARLQPSLSYAPLTIQPYLVQLCPLVSYNPQITPSLTIPTSDLYLDIRTVTLIYFSCILWVNDSRLVDLNPAYAQQLNISNVMITQNVGCGTTATQTPISSAILARMMSYTAAHPTDAELSDCVNGYPAELYDDYYNCVDVPDLNVFYAATETTVPPLVLGTPGAMGMMVVNGDASYGVPTMIVQRGGVNVNTTSDVASIAACARDTFDASTLSFDTDNPVNVTCWPWTQQVVAVVRKNYVSSASESSAEACSRGLNALQYLRWLFTSVQVDAVASSSNVVRLPSLSPEIQAAYLSALNGVLCDGETLLTVLPTEWQVSTGMSTGAGSICLIGSALCLCCIFYTAVFRSHPVIRSSAPHFLSMSLLGVAVLLVGTFLMVQTPTQNSCTALAWLWSFGFSLTFAPLFAKTWRIYRIFGRRRLSVVKISNRKLAVLVLVILALDLVLMSTWQALSPLQPYTSTVYTGSNPVMQMDYTQCGVEGDGRTMLGLVAVSKGVLLLFGALMAFSTRTVTSTFNESSGIALAIYNVLFSIGIITPIILVIHAVGDVLMLLLLFLGLWVSCFTAAILFVPKLLHIHGASAQQVTEGGISKPGSEVQFSFLSMAQLSTVAVVSAYAAALESHLSTVKRRLAELKAAKQGGTAVGQSVASVTQRSPSSEPRQQQDARRPTPSVSHHDTNTPSVTHKRLLSKDHLTASPSNRSRAEADNHLVLHQPTQTSPSKQRSTIAVQASPLSRESRTVAVGARGLVNGGGEASGVSTREVVVSKGFSLLGGTRSSSVSRVKEESRADKEAVAILS